MQLPASQVLQSLDGRAASMLALLKKQDVESLATSSAKRRFFRVELEVAGISPDHISSNLIAAAVEAGCNSLAIWLGSLKKLGEYARSSQRKKWNPKAGENDLASQVPIASDWFLQSTYRNEWDEFDFLSRCESIWVNNGFTGGGMLFTRIFDYRVKMLAGYEDGLRLVMLLAEVGDYVKPIELSSTPAKEEVDTKHVTVEAVDLVRRMQAFDGPEPKDWTIKHPMPFGKPEWAFSLGEVTGNKFKALIELLGKANFDQIMAAQGYKDPGKNHGLYLGEDDFQLYYFTRKGDVADALFLFIMSAGEFQPGRWMAHLEGIWRVKGTNF